MKYLCVIFLASSVAFCKAQQSKGDELSRAIKPWRRRSCCPCRRKDRRRTP